MLGFLCLALVHMTRKQRKLCHRSGSLSNSFPLHPFIPAGLLAPRVPALTEALKGKADGEDGKRGHGIEVHRTTVSCLERSDV